MSRFLLLWSKIGWRHMRRDGWSSLLLLAILSLGVATCLSVRMANRAATSGLDAPTQVLQGQADWVLRSAHGHLSSDDLRSVRKALDPYPADLFPVIESAGAIKMAEEDPVTVRLLGIDWIGGRHFADRGTGESPLTAMDAEPGHILISYHLAGRAGLNDGDGVDLLIGGIWRSFELAAVLPRELNGIPLPRDLVIFDLPDLQEIAREPGRVDRLEIYLEADHAIPDIQSRLGSWLLETPKQEALLNASMTAAFRLNLTVLSLIALLTGLYLILQGMDTAVARRREETAILRSLGITRLQIQQNWLFESFIWGSMAAVLGLVLGYLFARMTVGLVVQTVSTIYSQSATTAINPNIGDLLLAVVLGVGGSCLAGWFPAKDAAATPPAQLLQRGFRVPALPGFQSYWPGILLISLGILTNSLPPWYTAAGNAIPVGGYFTALFWLVGGTLLAAQLLRPAAAALRLIPIDRSWWLLGLSRLASGGSRRYLAISGFFVAAGMASSISLLIHSFESSLTHWLEERFNGDIYVSSVSFRGSGSDHFIDASAWQSIIEDPAVAAAAPYRSAPIRLQGRPTFIAGADWSLIDNLQPLVWRSRLPQALRPEGTDGAIYAIINENFSSRFNLSTGDEIQVPSPVGEQVVRIYGIHTDYGSDLGTLLVDFRILNAWFDFDNLTNLTLFLDEPSSAPEFAERMESQFPGLRFRQNEELRASALAIFHQTFRITRALQLIGLAVAFAGLILTIISLLREMRSELSTQWKLGMPRKGIALSTAIEGLGITLTGLFTGTVLSLALGHVLIYNVNYHSFGWTLEKSYPVGELLLAGLALTAAGTLVAFAVGWRYGSRFLVNLILLALLATAFTPASVEADSGVPRYNAEGFPVPQPGTELKFPGAHGSHPDYRIEWWYLTGHLDVDEQPAYGFQATFFRFRNQPRDPENPDHSSFGRNTIHLGHMAITDIRRDSFHHAERLRRDGWDAWARPGGLDVRNGNWTLQMTDEQSEQMSLRFTVPGPLLANLELNPVKPLVVFGEDGTSRKGKDPAARSYYMSFTRLAVNGKVQVGDSLESVSGLAWMDHEVASQQLGDDLAGWDWTAIQLEDGREVKAYILRREDGSPDPWSRLIWIDENNQVTEIDTNNFEWETVRWWQSPHSEASYPIELKIHTTDPKTGESISFHLIPVRDDQEMRLDGSVSNYWEGACEVFDENGRYLGRAYLELVGYAGEVSGVR